MRTAPGALLCCLFLLNACDVDPDRVSGADASPPILVAAEQGDLAALNLLLVAGAAPDVLDNCNWTPLMKAALNGHLDVVKRLLDAGADPSVEDKGGYTALMLAASNDHAETVSLLLERGADMNHAEATGGWTALIWAAKRGHVRSVEVLLAHGADPGLTDLSGRRAIDYARENGHIPVIRSLNGMPLSPADH